MRQDALSRQSSVVRSGKVVESASPGIIIARSLGLTDGDEAIANFVILSGATRRGAKSKDLNETPT